MPATDAQIAANRADSLKSSGPSTPQGKEASRGNALKHGLTAAKLFPEHEGVEIQRRTIAFVEELDPSGEVGVVLARHAARMSVRMERCSEHEKAMLTERVRRALDEFVPPEGVTDPAELAKLRSEVERRALFDDSREACLARKYEAVAERSFFRALKELRQHERQVKAAEAEAIDEKLASILPGAMTDEEFDARYAEAMGTPPPGYASTAGPVDFGSLGGRVDVPISIGKRR